MRRLSCRGTRAAPRVTPFHHGVEPRPRQVKRSPRESRDQRLEFVHFKGLPQRMGVRAKRPGDIPPPPWRCGSSASRSWHSAAHPRSRTLLWNVISTPASATPPPPHGPAQGRRRRPARCRRAPSAARVVRRHGLARGGGPVPGGPPGGGRFEGTGNWQAFAIRDGQLITGQNQQSTHLAARELLKAMRTADAQDGRHPWSTVRGTASG
jgi:hypothetical protein